MWLMWLVSSVSITSSMLIAMFVVPKVATEVLLGMAGPVAVAIGSIAITNRTSRRNPKKLTRLLIWAFVMKMVIFGVYLLVLNSVLILDAITFVISFTVNFVALHIVEGFYLQQLLVSNETSQGILPKT